MVKGGWQKGAIAFALALIAVLAFRALAITIYAVDGDALSPELEKGDHVMVNRWSYGLRTGKTGSLFDYGRVLRQSFNRGDIVAYEDPRQDCEGNILIGCIKALPGDTLRYHGNIAMVPSLKDCAEADFFWLESIGEEYTIDSRALGFIAEQFIIGRVFAVAFNHDPGQPLWQGWQWERTMLWK